MSFAFRRGRTWFIGYLDETGRQVRRRSAATTKEAAKRLAALEEEHAEKVRLGHAAPREPPHTWDELCARYLNDVVPTLKQSKAMGYRVAKHLSPAFAGKLLARLKPGDVQAWLAGLQDSHAPGSRETLRMSMQGVFTYGQEALGWCDSNPAKEVGRVPVPQERPRFLTQEEATRLLDAAPEWLRGVFAVALYCGLRKGELAGLRWEDVDLGDMLLRVRRSFGGSTKGKRERAVGIPLELLPYLLEAKRRSLGSAWVFPNPMGKGRPSWKLDKHFPKALKAAGIHKALTFRHLRSTFGTQLYRLSGDIRGVQLAIGHSDVGTTIRHYAATPEGLLKALAAKLSYATPAQLPAGQVVDVTPEEKPVKAPTSSCNAPQKPANGRKRKYKAPSVVSVTHSGGGWAVSVASCRSRRPGTPGGLPRGGK